MRILHLNLRSDFFEAIKSGQKVEEFRLVTPHWRRRLEGQAYDVIHIKRGYPKKGDTERVIERPWNGVERRTVTRPFFGPVPVEVFAIKVN